MKKTLKRHQQEYVNEHDWIENKNTFYSHWLLYKDWVSYKVEDAREKFGDSINKFLEVSAFYILDRRKEREANKNNDKK